MGPPIHNPPLRTVPSKGDEREESLARNSGHRMENSLPENTTSPPEGLAQTSRDMMCGEGSDEEKGKALCIGIRGTGSTQIALVSAKAPQKA